MKKSSKKNAVTDLLALVAGAAIAAKLSNTPLPVIPPKLQPFLPVVAGFLLAKKGGRMMQGVGAGMIAVGGVKALNSFAPGLGIGEGMSDYQIEGATDYSLAGGITEGVSGSKSYALAGNDDNFNSDLNG